MRHRGRRDVLRPALVCALHLPPIQHPSNKTETPLGLFPPKPYEMSIENPKPARFSQVALRWLELAESDT